MRTFTVLAAASVLAFTATACSDIDSGSSSGKVTYKVTGTGGVTKADMTFTDGSTQTTQEAAQKLPWKKTVKVADDVIVYQVMAQNTGGAKGSVTCEILLDGKSVKKNTSKGAGAIATCEHTP